MYESNLTNYLTGMSMMASCMVNTPSFVTIDVYTKENHDTSTFIKSEYSVNEFLSVWFNGKKDILENATYLINSKVGSPINIYEVTDEEFKKIEEDSKYYFLEELYVVEYDKYFLYYMIGNNE